MGKKPILNNYIPKQMKKRDAALDDIYNWQGTANVGMPLRPRSTLNAVHKTMDPIIKKAKKFLKMK